MTALRDCPASASWQLLFTDAVPAEQRESYERHLESCSTCQARLDQIQEDPELLELAREVGDPTNTPADATLVQVLDRLLKAKGSNLTTPSEPADLYFLRPTDRPDLLGTLGGYEVQEVIGEGGMGVVLKAFEPALHRLVAIKVLAPAVAGSAVARKRFTREAQAAAAVSHDHIVPVYGVHEADGLPYLVMQYVAGESLQGRLDRSGSLEVMEVVRIGLQTAQGLAAAHAQGLIHRDIKPANLLLENGLAKVKITDFGLARMTDDVQLTQAGVVAGTPEYMAPEQARGELVDHRADLFSLGCVLYVTCTGLPPFRGTSTLAVLRRVTEQAPTPVRWLNPDVPAWLETLVDRLLTKDPAGRFQSAAEVAALLEGYLAHLRQPTTVPAPELPGLTAVARRGVATARKPARPPAQRLKKPGLMLTALALGLVVLGLAFGLRWLTAPGLRETAQLLGAGDANQGPVKEPTSFRQDFRGTKVNDQFLQFTSPEARDQVTEGAEGLRITVVGDTSRMQACGLVLRFRVKGDCEITVSYDLLRADVPTKGYAAGVGLEVVTDTPTRESAKIARFTRKNGPCYYCERITTNAQGKREYPTKMVTTEARSGKLRLVRRGAVIFFLVAENGEEEFKPLHQSHLGKEDLVSVRVAAECSFADAGAEVRIRDFDVRSQVALNDPPPADVVPEEAASKPRERTWLAKVLLIGFLLTLALLVPLGVWLYVRQHRARPKAASVPIEDEPAQPKAASASISFRCSGCGKALKTRAELAGKTFKCPQCSQGVMVPGIKAAPPSGTL